ncbi:hypothetical protein [Flindersiella endophytica]
MSYKDDYRNENTEAPFYWLISTLRTYLEPEVYDFDQLVDDLQSRSEWTRQFKDQHRAALLDPSQLPDGAIYWAASYDDGNQVRYLRRLWRDLYPGEPVPGGDDEFREDLRKLISGEVEHRPLPTTVIEYDDSWGKPATVEELQELGRRIWQRFYPDEPLP